MQKSSWILLLVFCSAPAWATPDTSSTMENLKSKTRQLALVIQQKTKSPAEAHLPLDKQLSLLEERTRDTQAKLKAHNLRIGLAEAQIHLLEAQQLKQQSLLAQQLRLEARSPAREGLKLVLSASDLPQMQRLLHDYQSIRQAQRQQLTTLSVNLENQHRERATLVEEKSALAQLEADLLRQQGVLHKKRDHAARA